MKSKLNFFNSFKNLLLITAVLFIYCTFIVLSQPDIPRNSLTGEYEISTKSQYEDLARWVNNTGNINNRIGWSTTNLTFKLMNDIGTSSSPVSVVIGKSYGWSVNVKTSFQGTFNGNDKTIHVDISLASANGYTDLGVFGMLEGATIRNLNVAGYVIGNSTCVVGGIVAYSLNSIIEYCTNTATVYFPSSYVGGIAGVAEKTIIRYCNNSGMVIGNNSVGGILGFDMTSNTIYNCTNIGDIGLDRISNGVGGIVGYSENTGSRIEDCANSGLISGIGSIGGIIGTISNMCIVKNCLNTGVIKASNVNNNVGAIAGSSAQGFLTPYTDNIINCYYDKQMCPIFKGVNGQDIAGRAVGKLTRELKGFSITLSSNWTRTTDLYPRTMLVNDVCYVAASPITLLDDDNNIEEIKLLSLTRAFTYSIANGVIWGPSSSLRVNFGGSGNGLFVGIPGAETIYAQKGIYRKNIPMVMVMAKISISEALASAMGTFSVGEVTPNIVTNNATIDIATATEGNLNVAIYDLAGSKIMDVVDEFVNENTLVKVDLNNLSNLATGSYVVVVTSGNDVAVRKFIKQ